VQRRSAVRFFGVYIGVRFHKRIRGLDIGIFNGIDQANVVALRCDQLRRHQQYE
jgi:hypothetical protein